MILVDTFVLVAWLDKSHPQQARCRQAIYEAARETLAVSSFTYAGLAAGGRTGEGVDEDFNDFERLDLDFADAWRAGQAFRQKRGKVTDDPVLPDFLIRAQATTRNLPHLTNDRRRTGSFPDVDFLFV